MLEISATLDATHLMNALASSADAFGSPTSGDIGDGASEAQLVYLASMRRRYMTASQRDGTWQDQAPSTKLARFYRAGGKLGRGKGRTSRDTVLSTPYPILYETGSLYSSLFPDQPGNVFETHERPHSCGERREVCGGAAKRRG